MNQAVPVMPLVREILKGSSTGLTVTEMRHVLLDIGVAVEGGELTSCASKLLQAEQVERERVQRTAGMGQSQVWRYRWKDRA